jgi:hypothetical protein
VKKDIGDTLSLIAVVTLLFFVACAFLVAGSVLVWESIQGSYYWYTVFAIPMFIIGVCFVGMAVSLVGNR